MNRPIPATRLAASLTVWVQPGASRERVVGMHGDALKVAVTAPPEKSKANLAVETLLAKELRMPNRSVQVVAGESARRKTVRITGLTQIQLDTWLTAQDAKSAQKG